MVQCPSSGAVVRGPFQIISLHRGAVARAYWKDKLPVRHRVCLVVRGPGGHSLFGMIPHLAVIFLCVSRAPENMREFVRAVCNSYNLLAPHMVGANVPGAIPIDKLIVRQGGAGHPKMLIERQIVRTLGGTFRTRI